MICKQQHRCFDGTVYFYQHQSDITKTSMNFSIYLPDKILKPRPYLLFLSGLTCTEENFTTKANAYRLASELGLAIVVPDTSPRGDTVANSSDYDLGQGASFYLNATEMPWKTHFQMESYLIDELLMLLEKQFALSRDHKAISGHSMGGHGALTLFLKYPGLFQSCSAFSPIVAPSQCSWGIKAFTAYLGTDRTHWSQHDACELIRNNTLALQNNPILIDQGLNDEFLESQLRISLFEEACQTSQQKLTLRYHDKFDHSYYFIASFINDHLRWHAEYII